jgi:hypothetical protein
MKYFSSPGYLVTLKPKISSSTPYLLSLCSSLKVTDHISQTQHSNRQHYSSVYFNVNAFPHTVAPHYTVPQYTVHYETTWRHQQQFHPAGNVMWLGRVNQGHGRENKATLFSKDWFKQFRQRRDCFCNATITHTHTHTHTRARATESLCSKMAATRPSTLEQECRAIKWLQHVPKL